MHETDAESEQWDIPAYCMPEIEKFFGKNIIIYGAGKVGKNYYAQASKYEHINISLWVDKEPQKYSYAYYSIRPVEDIQKTDFDFIIIAVLKQNIAEEITDELVSMGLPRAKIIWQSPLKRPASEQIPAKKTVGHNIIRIMGGIGNQMFQYALYKALNKVGHYTEANISGFTNKNERPFELFKAFPNLRMDIDVCNDYDAYKNPLNEHKLFTEKEDGVFDKSVFEESDVSFIGYWQSEKYFMNVKDSIIKDFAFDVSEPSLRDFAESLLQKENTVSLHVRRGDYFKYQNNIELYGGICTVEYYKKAINYMNTKVKEAQYVVFSDDLQWAKENLNIPNAIFVSQSLFNNYKNWYDMYLMTCCKHNIAANSSFSWWGVYLNKNPNKIVITPSRYLNTKPTTDTWCEGWIRIDGRA